MSTIVDQIAAALPQLVHPEHGPVMLVNFQTFPGQDDEQQAQISSFVRIVAEAIEHTLDERGIAMITKTELAQTPRVGSYEIGKIICKTCANPLLPGVVIEAGGVIALAPGDVRAINLDCEAQHGAA